MSPAISSGSPVFLTGDFNEPSHLDWTQAAANAGLHFGKKVDWPTSHAVVNAGLNRFVSPTAARRHQRSRQHLDAGLAGPDHRCQRGLRPHRFCLLRGARCDALSGEHARLQRERREYRHWRSSRIRPTIARWLSLFNLPTCSVVCRPERQLLQSASTIGRSFAAGQQVNLTGLTPSQAYAMGDLNGDFRNDHADFVIFKTALRNGEWHRIVCRRCLASVPEPSAVYLALAFGTASRH